MATAAVTNTFVNGTSADADQVNTNFSDLVSFLNNSVVHADGSVAFTSNVDAGSNKVVNVSAPTSDTDAANKAYVDDSNLTSKFTRDTNIVVAASGSGSVTFESEDNDDDGWWSSGTTFTCPANGLYAIAVEATRASGSGSVTVSVVGDEIDSGGSASITASASRSTAGGISYLRTGDTFTVNYQNLSGVDSLTIDQVQLIITKLGLI